jgi:MFS family permease
MSRLQTRRAAIAGSIGTVIEYYEFFIYGISAAFVFNNVFFSSLTPAVATMVSFSTFAIAFAARPVGAVVIGHLGDRVGRKRMLILTLTSMGVATLLIGLLPTYDQIGLTAPVLLVVFRLVQGFALGGEFGGAVLMSMEHTRPDRRSFYGSWVQTGAPIGTVLANVTFLLVTLLPEDAFMAWGWRLPFFLSAGLILLGSILRTSLDESPAFEKLQKSEAITRNPLKEVLSNHLAAVFKVAGASLGGGVIFYLLTVYALSYGEANLGLGRAEMLDVVIATLLLAIVLMVVAGHLADRFGRRKVFSLGILGMTVMVVPWIKLFGTGTLSLVLVGYLAMAVPYAAVQGTAGVFFAQAFPAPVRYSGLSLGYTLGMVAGSAVAPMIAALLYDRFGSLTAVAVYMIVAGAISTVCALSLRERPADEPTLAASDEREPSRSES